jgi:hypothetical protein
VDIDTVTEFVPARGAAWREGDAWLGGGTWLFSQPQPALRRLLDLTDFGWRPLTETRRGLEIAATCTLAELARWRPARDWPAASLARQCCHALLGSFKVQNVATVGGNICLSLPTDPMTAGAGQRGPRRDRRAHHQPPAAQGCRLRKPRRGRWSTSAPIVTARQRSAWCASPGTRRSTAAT